MTAQIQDCYKFEGKEYELIGLSQDLGFNPQKYGLEPHTSSTACWNGYWCDYEITGEQLLLKNLYLFNENDNYPPIMGVYPSPITYHDVEVHFSKDGESVMEIRQEPDYDGHRLYKDIDMEIPYTGKILVGSDFISDYYIHMGYQSSWAYETLLEFVFENGILKEVNDQSDIAKRQREDIDESPTKWFDEDDIFQNVTNAFSLDYKDKAWWLTDDDFGLTNP